MSGSSTVCKIILFAMVLLATLQAKVEAQGKFSSSWVADAKYSTIRFKFTRQKDPGGGKATEFFKYGYKNTSESTWRISYEITGAGLTKPHIGSVVVKAGQTKSNSLSMFLDGDPGGHLTSRITRLDEIGDRLKAIQNDFKDFEDELSPKEAKELSNKEIRRILKDNQSKIHSQAKIRQNPGAASRPAEAASTNGFRKGTSSKSPQNSASNRSQRKSQPKGNPQSGNGAGDARSTSTGKTTVSTRAFISPGDIGGGRIMLSPGGTADQKWRKGTWSLTGNRLKLQLKSSSGASGVNFDGTLTESVDFSNGKRKIIFTGTKEHWGGTNPRTRKGAMALYPDG